MVMMMMMTMTMMLFFINCMQVDIDQIGHGHTTMMKGMLLYHGHRPQPRTMSMLSVFFLFIKYIKNISYINRI